MRAFGARDHVATVLGTTHVTSHCIRVYFHSDTLFDDAVTGPTAWVRGWFPDGEGKEFQRGYTFSEADSATGDFALDFVLHEPAGPASAWAEQASPGDTLSVVSMSSMPFEVPAENRPSGYLLIGDSASIPALNSLIAVIPEDLPVELYLEEHVPADREIPLNSHPRMRVQWVGRDDATSLAAALENRDWSNWYLWTGPESGTLKEIRKRAKDFGFPKSEIHALAYWAQGKAMGKERDPEEMTGQGEASQVQTIEPTSPVEIPHASSDQVHKADQVDLTEAAPRGQAAEGVVQGQWRAAGGGRLLAPLRRTLTVAGVAQVIVTLLQLAPYVVLAELGRRILSGSDARALWSVGVVALVLIGVSVLLNAALTTWLHAVDARFSRDLRSRLLTKMSRLPLGWFDSRNSGTIKSLVADNTLSLHYLVTHAVLDAVAAVIAPIAVLVYLFIVDWGLALCLLIPVLGYIVTMYRMMVRSGPKIPMSQAWAERMNGEAGAYLDAQPVIRVFGGAMSSRFRRNLDDYITFLEDWQKPFIKAKTIMDLITRPTTFLWLIAAAGTFFVIWGWIEPVDLLPFLFLGTTFGARLLGIGYGMIGLRTGIAAARDIAAVLDEPEIDVREVEPVTGEPVGTVVFDHVTFGYRTDTPVLHDISLTLRPGTVTALVGSSGSGKSTMASLLARFHDVDQGAIRIGGRDISSMTTDELYQQLGFVLQHSELVAGTVAENIALAVPEASPEQIEAAARAAGIHERIERLARGYDTELSADAGLSGGERQRVTIARALLADAPILILDEATAFADPESEYLVQQSLSRLVQDRTVLVIAHRLHTIVDVDHIVVLDGGRIIESGSHGELMSAGGRYRELWESTESSDLGAQR